jgi:septal ring factor EnvC (AmiA/AmiB activator)
MLDAPTGNIKLTLEQLQQLDMFNDRLANIQNEIKSANKILTAAKNDCDRITKERDYQQTLLDKVNQDLEEKQAKVTALDETHAALSTAITELDAEIKRKRAAMEEKAKVLKEREDAAEKREHDATSCHEGISRKIVEHEGDKAAFYEKVATLKSVLETF